MVDPARNQRDIAPVAAGGQVEDVTDPGVVKLLAALEKLNGDDGDYIFNESTAMMKKIMHDKNVDSLEELIRKAIAQGVRIVACTMSMDVMGIKEEELIEGVELGGVGAYLGDAEESNVNLFI